MKNLFYFILFSLLSSSAWLYGYNASNRLNANSISDSIPNQSETCDTIIETRLYKITDSLIKQLIDTSLVVDPYNYLILSPSSNKLFPDQIELLHQPITAENIKFTKGVYVDSLSGKSVIFMALNDTMLNTYGFFDTGLKRKLKIGKPLKENLKINLLGITNYIKYTPDSIHNMSVSLGYNGQTIFKYPEIAKKFSFIGDSAVDDEIRKHQENSRILKKVIKRLRKNASENSTIPNTTNGDTIRLYVGFVSHSIEKDIDKYISLPIYTFNNSFSGTLSKRICDTLAINDIYRKHYIISNKTNSKGCGITIYGEFTLPDSVLFNPKGIILANANDHPFLIYDITPETLEKFGIICSGKKIVAYLEIKKYFPIIDDTPPGFFVKITEGDNDIINIDLAFANRRLFEEEARIFQWIIDEYINEYYLIQDADPK